MKRLTPDPAVGVTDLMGPLRKMCEQAGTWDLLRLLGGMTWKSTIDAEWLGQAHLSSLFVDLFKVHKNGVLSSNKTKLALQKIQGTVHRMNFSKRDDQTWLDLCDEQLRICASQYRELKNYNVKYQRAMKKASNEEKEYVDRVLDMLDFNQVVAEEKTGDVEEKPCDKPAPVKVPALQDEDLPGLVIFQNILQKASSDPHSPEPVRAKQTKVGSKSQEVNKKKQTAMVPDLDALRLNANEQDELLAWMLADVEEVKRPRRLAAKKKPSTKKTGAKVSQAPKTKAKKFSVCGRKNIFRHRATPSAYHKARNLALKQGKTANAVKSAARAAARKVAEAIDAGDLVG